MSENRNKKGFFILHDKAFAFHIGAFICVDKYAKEIYLFFCFGKHDFSIGYRWEDSNYKDEGWDLK